MSAPNPVTVTDNQQASRYEATTDAGVVAGFADYRLTDGVVTFTHTEVDDAFEGEGVGSELVRVALDEAREQGHKVRPVCPFVASWIEEHPEYRELVTEG